MAEFHLASSVISTYSVMAERVGFEPTVPLPGRMLSKHVDSSTLAPLRNFRERDLSTHVFERQGERLTLFQCFPILPNDRGHVA
ncbi:protein of unknown function [Nitrospira japonica]|uniref:Uncharacterized protein n=1 Tax=Nitrospira japonica TaxID=1325564 RepID=A0A1W1I3E6_9BACT|nr:protein of unknown function [Nitrospira japonica]